MGLNKNQCETCKAPVTEGVKYCPKCQKEAHKEASRLYHAARRKERAEKGLCTKCGESKKLPKNFKQYLSEKDPELVELINMEQLKDSNFCYRCYVARKLVSLEKRREKERLNPTPKLTPEEKEALRKQQVLEAGRNRRAKVLAENPNVCGHCLKRDKAEGKSWCQFCLDKASKINNSRINKRKKNDKCITCGKKSGGKQLCPDCSQVQKQYSKKWWKKVKQEREEAGICLRCGINKTEDGKKSCDECLNKIKEYTQSKSRICPQCNKNELEFKQRRCADCKEINRIEKNKKSTARKKAKKEAEKAKAKKVAKKTPKKTISPEAEAIKTKKPKPVAQPEIIIENTILPATTMFANHSSDTEDDEF